MNREDFIGTIVKSKAGRDKGKYFIIVEVIDKNYVLIADGSLKTQDKPKKKKLRHLNFTDIIAKDIRDQIRLGNKGNDSTIRKFLQLNDFDKEV